MRTLTLFAFLPIALSAQESRYINLNATLWQKTSVEYTALCRQAYANARFSLDRTLKNKKVTAAAEQEGQAKINKLKPAVIFDIDETLVDNSIGQSAFILEGSGRYVPAIWDRWSKEARAQAVAGALDFVRYARSRGVTVIYVTNRPVRQEEDTRRNLLADGFEIQNLGKPEVGLGDALTTVGERPEWTSDKSIRRALIAKYYRIVMLCGDDLNDFMPGALTTLEKRRELAAKFDRHWGSLWTILPNPGYGSWENSILDFQNNLSDDGVLQKKIEVLRKP